MEKIIFGFFTALGLVLLILGAVIRGSKDTASKKATSGQSSDFDTALKNIERSSNGIIVIGVFMFVLSGVMLFKHMKGSSLPSLSIPAVPQQTMRRYYF